MKFLPTHLRFTHSESSSFSLKKNYLEIRTNVHSPFYQMIVETPPPPNIIHLKCSSSKTFYSKCKKVHKKKLKKRNFLSMIPSVNNGIVNKLNTWLLMLKPFEIFKTSNCIPLFFTQHVWATYIDNDTFHRRRTTVARH